MPAGASALPAKPVPSKCRLLDEWLWAPFRAPSIVFSTGQQGPFLRDEKAEFHLGRRLGYETEFEQIKLRDSRWQELLSKSPYQAVCFIGRLGLYGKDAPGRLMMKRGRLEFPEQFRPENMAPAELDSVGLYHCIFEHLGIHHTEKYFTTEEGGKRTDHAVVQRYQRSLNGRDMTVITIAGCTPLGTCAAAFWAAERLFQPIDSTGNCLEVPHGIRDDSVLEALLKVTASEPGSTWRFQEIVPLRLYVDDHCWSPKSHTWNEVPIEEICLLTRKDGRSVFLFNGRSSRLQPNRNYGRLLAAMMQQKIQSSCDVIDVDQLANDTSIWKDKAGDVQTTTVRHVYKVLKDLRSQHLRSALTVEQENVRLQASVHFESKA